MHDAYRPWYVTKIFWDATPTDKHEFVADPAVGSRHNRGCAVDLTLYDLKTGRTVEMPGLYDEMSARAYPTYAGGTAEQRRLRDLWHFDYRDWKSYAIQNARFEALGATRWAMGRRAPLRMWLVVTGADEMVRRAGFLWALTGLMRRAPTA